MVSLRELAWQHRVARGGQRSLMRLIQSLDEELLRVVEQAAKDAGKIISGLPGAQVGVAARRAAYAQAQKQLYAVAGEMWGDAIPARITNGLGVSTQMAANEQRQLMAILTRGAPEAAGLLSDSMIHSAARAFQDVRSRLLNDIDLSSAVYRNQALMQGTVDRLVTDGIALGQSAKEIADAVVGYINPATPGGARYAAQRLGRTELNNAFHTTSIRSYQQSPYVRGVMWNVSDSHGQDDECDEYEAESPFEPDAVPFKPHPNCFCYLTPATPSPDEFIDEMTSGRYNCS